MKTPNCAHGLLSLCLILSSGCSSMARSPAPLPIVNECPRVQPCTLPAVTVASNGDVRAAVDRAEAAWAECAAVVDLVVKCQAEAEQAKGTP